MELWTRRVRGVGATSDMRMTACGHGKPHHRMRKPWGFQEVSRKTWQILWTWGMGAWQIVYMANYGSPVSRKAGDYPSRHHPHPPALCSPIAYATSSRVASGAGTRYERCGAGLLHTSGVRVRGDRGPTGKRSTPPTPHGTTELTAPSHLALGLPRLLAYSPSSLESSLSHRRSNHRAERPKG